MQLKDLAVLKAAKLQFHLQIKPLCVFYESFPQQLFHVEPTDFDDETGAKLDEVILVRLIANTPGCLKYKPLRWFLDEYLYDNGKVWKA